MLTTLTWIRNILTLVGLLSCIIIAANMHYNFFDQHWSHHYFTITPFVLAFNFHVVLVFLTYWNDVFEKMQANVQKSLDKND